MATLHNQHYLVMMLKDNFVFKKTEKSKCQKAMYFLLGFEQREKHHICIRYVSAKKGERKIYIPSFDSNKKTSTKENIHGRAFLINQRKLRANIIFGPKFFSIFSGTVGNSRWFRQRRPSISTSFGSWQNLAKQSNCSQDESHYNCIS